jgi:hypothetical protein
MTLIDELQERVEVKSRELNLLLKLNRIRDQINKPKTILRDIVELMESELEAKFCVLIGIDLESKRTKVLSFTQIDDNLIDYKLILRRDIIIKALNLQKLGIWKAKDLIKDRVVDQIEVATLPLKIRNQKMGTLLIGRKREFNKYDKEILDIASEIISSILYQIAFMKSKCK